MSDKECLISDGKFPRTGYERATWSWQTTERPVRSPPVAGKHGWMRDTKIVLSGKQKAAMLLMSLDAETAAELLRGFDSEVVKELAEELVHLDAAGLRSDRESLRLARQFCNLLQADQEFRIKGFLKEILKSTVGAEKAEHIQTRIQDLLYKRDPFISIRSVESKMIALVLENEHPQVAAVVLSGLSAKKNAEVLSFLDGSVRISAIGRMNSCENMTAQEKAEIAKAVCRRLEAIATRGGSKALQSWPKQSLRKVAVILRNLGKEIRDGMLGAIKDKDSQAGEVVVELMIVWEDILQVADSSLQEALKGIDIKRLALALVKANDRLVRKIRSNISEPAVAMLDEELLLMSAYKRKDVEEARGEIVQVLRAMNEKGKLAFIEEEYDV